MPIPSDEPKPLKRKALRALHGFLADALAPLPPLRVLDIGANPLSAPGYSGLLDIGACEVWAFEPGDDAFEALEAGKAEGAHYVKAAVGAPGPSDFHMHPQSGLSSAYPVHAPSVQYLGRPLWADPKEGQIKTVQMDLVALDDLDAVPQPDVVKIDIQGGELAVFQNGRAKMSEAVAVITEARFYRIYEDEPLWADVDIELRDQGFTLNRILFAKETTVKTSRRRWLRHRGYGSQMVDGDAVYIRNPETISDWSDDQVRRLALAASCVFQSHDIACYCLDELERRGLAPEGVTRGYVQLLPDPLGEKSGTPLEEMGAP